MGQLSSDPSSLEGGPTMKCAGLGNEVCTAWAN